VWTGFFCLRISDVWAVVKRDNETLGFTRFGEFLTILEILATQKGLGARGSSVVKVLCYKSEGRWFDPSWCQWILH